MSSNKINPASTSDSSGVVRTPKVAVTPAPTLHGPASANTSSKSSPKTGPTPLSGVVRHSGITPASTPTESGPQILSAPHPQPPPPASPSSRPSTAASTPLLKRETSSRVAATTGSGEKGGAAPHSPLSIQLPSAASASNNNNNNNNNNAMTPAGSVKRVSLPPPIVTTAATATTTAATPASVHSATTQDESPIDDRGWDPVMDGRLRVALMHHFAEDIDEGERDANNNNNSTSHPSAFTNCVPDEMNADAAAQCEEEAHRTPTHDAFCNRYFPGEPCIEIDVEASLVNAINSAYTSTGYPFVVTAGNTRGAVYGSFVDTSNPSLSSLELPPAQSYIVAPSYTGGQSPVHGMTEMDTLLAIQWSRGDRMMTSAGSAAAAAVAASQGKSASSAAGNGGTSAAAAGGASATKRGGESPGSAPRPSSAGPAGAPHSPAVARTIAHHLTQYPEGIHGIHTSLHLRQVLIEGTLPTSQAFAPSAPINSVACAPLAVAGGSVGTAQTAAAAGGNPTGTSAAGGNEEVKSNNGGAAAAATTNTAGGGGSPTSQMPPNAEANVPPLPRPVESNAPVQHTLISASTFNHLSVYVVAHQDGKMLYTAALQSLSASIATRKVTAHQLILVGREEVHALVSDPLAAVTTKPERRTRISFANVPVSGNEAAVLFQSKTSRCVGADAARRTVSAAPVRFTVEPHLIFGNQNGDIFIFSLLQEKIVQHINFNAGTQQVSSSIASGNSGVGSKLICSPVSAIVEVQNGIEKKITSMIEYATVAKRNHRPSFESDDVPSAFTPAGATEPTHYYYPVPPSLYAVGFDNGQMLLLCVTCEGGWMLRHFNSQYFGLRPIHSIAVRVPPFWTRVWTSSLPAITKVDAKVAETKPPTTLTALVTPEQALIVHEEDQHIAAVACNGGVIALVRLPGMEIISSVAPTDYNAVGEILALQWTSTSTRHLLTPDVLVSSGEDDTMTAFQLLSASAMSAAESSYHPHNNNNGMETVSHLSSNESVLAGGRLRILEKKKFHRSWVNRLNLFPIVLPATGNAVPNMNSSNTNHSSSGGSAGRANSSAKRVACATGGGMPQYVGVCLLATSYDRRTSFWPYIFSTAEELADDGSARRSMEGSTVNGSLAVPSNGGNNNNNNANNSGDVGQDFGSGSGALLMNQLSSVATPDHYVLVDGPTAAYPLHTELVVSVAAAGGGTSFFLTTVCCRGKVKFWSMKVKV